MKYLPFMATKEGLLSNQISYLGNEKLAISEISQMKYPFDAIVSHKMWMFKVTTANQKILIKSVDITIVEDDTIRNP